MHPGPFSGAKLQNLGMLTILKGVFPITQIICISDFMSLSLMVNFSVAF